MSKIDEDCQGRLGLKFVILGIFPKFVGLKEFGRVGWKVDRLIITATDVPIKYLSLYM